MSLTRELKLDAANTRREGDDLVVAMSFASEQPYERWWGIEILDCTPAAVRLGRLNDGAALLFNHNWNDLRGAHVPGSVRCDADNVVRGDVRITSATEKGREAIALVETRILSKTSIGYEIHTVIEQSVGKSGDKIERTLDGRAFERVLSRSQRDHAGDVAAFQRALDAHAGAFERAADQPATYRVIDWEPLENSLVTVPADTSVGVGRSLESAPAAAAEPLIETPIIKEQHMPDPVIHIDEAAVEARGRDAANKRVADLLALGEQFKRFDIEPLVRQAMQTGESVSDFSRRLMDHIATKSAFDPSVGMSAQETRAFSITRAIRAMMSNDWSAAGLERAASQAFADKAAAAGIQRQAENSFFLPFEVQRRDMTVGTAANGGNMVATELRPQDFIGLLRARSLLMDLGARTMSGLVGNADITKQSAGATGYWLANEATAITESQQTLGLLSLRPKVLGAYTEVSRLLLQQSTPDADAFIMGDLAGTLATAIDVAGFATGGSGAPVGILGTASIGAFTGTALGLAALIDAQVDVATANALVSGCAYVTTPAVAGLLSARPRVASTDSVSLWKGNILDGNIEGFRAASSTNIPAATMIFGDFSQVIVADWGSIEIATNPYANFAAGISGIRAFQTVDVGVRVAGAFSAATAIT
ncbi:MAG: phage major capsid protein [Nevskia sp.]|jgi:HK97 family phage major capsid protein|nr:phage major capsid protein [Nevskia sp.]